MSDERLVTPLHSAWSLRLIRLMEACADGDASPELLAQHQHVDAQTKALPEPIEGTAFPVALDAYAAVLGVRGWTDPDAVEVLRILRSLPAPSPESLGSSLRRAILAQS